MTMDEDGILHSHHHENLKSYIVLTKLKHYSVKYADEAMNWKRNKTTLNTLNLYQQLTIKTP
jgi:hypothetical protein